MKKLHEIIKTTDHESLSGLDPILCYLSTFLSFFMCIGGGKLIMCHVIVTVLKTGSLFFLIFFLFLVKIKQLTLFFFFFCVCVPERLTDCFIEGKEEISATYWR